MPASASKPIRYRPVEAMRAGAAHLIGHQRRHVLGESVFIGSVVSEVNLAHARDLRCLFGVFALHEPKTFAQHLTVPRHHRNHLRRQYMPSDATAS